MIALRQIWIPAWSPPAGTRDAGNPPLKTQARVSPPQFAAGPAERCANGSSLINMARAIPKVRSWLYAEIERGMPAAAVEVDTPQALAVIFRGLQRLAGTPGTDGDQRRPYRWSSRRRAAGVSLGGAISYLAKSGA